MAKKAVSRKASATQQTPKPEPKPKSAPKRKRRRVSDKRKGAILAEVAKGEKTNEQIAKEYGISAQTIYNWKKSKAPEVKKVEAPKPKVAVEGGAKGLLSAYMHRVWGMDVQKALPQTLENVDVMVLRLALPGETGGINAESMLREIISGCLAEKGVKCAVHLEPAKDGFEAIVALNAKPIQINLS